MRRLCAAALGVVFAAACTVEDAIPRRADAGSPADSGSGQDAAHGGSAGAAGSSGSDAGGSAGDAAVADVEQQDSSDGAAGTDSAAGSGGADGGDADATVDAAGCTSGEVECAVPGAPSCWGAGTDCATLTECKGSWAACAKDFSPHCGDVRGFACCPALLPVFCDVAGPPLGCWEPGIDCSTIADCSGAWFACPAGQKYVCGQGCKGN